MNKLILTENEFKQFLNNSIRQVLKEAINKEQRLLKEGAADRAVIKYITNNCDNYYKKYLNTPVSEIPKDLYNSFLQMHRDWVENNPNMRVSDFLRLDLQTYFDINRGKGPVEFLPGIARIACEELGYFQANRNEGDMSRFKQLVMIIHNDEEIKNRFDRNLNNYSFYDLNKEIAPILKSKAEANKQKLKDFKTTNNEYRIIPINSFKEARKFSKYTSWCVTQGASHFNTYTQGGNRFYFCLRNVFENVSEVTGDTCPLDDYGLSMISVLVDTEGEPVHITTRWNHKYDGEDNPNLKTSKQFQELLGINFYDTFLPYTKDELHEMGIIPLYEVPELLASGVEPKKIFDYISDFREDFAIVKLNNKYNFINKNCELLTERWFDFCGDFYEGFAAIKINDKWNFINQNCELLNKEWFDFCGDFYEGFAAININNKWNYINPKGELLNNQWFDRCDNFKRGFAKVGLNYKYNFINQEGKFLFNQWFDICGDFYRGFAVVKLNGKYNFINQEGKILSNQWFDDCLDFQESFARVELNGKYNFINKKCELLSEEWFDDCLNFQEGFARVELNGKYNFINKKCEFLFNQWFDLCLPFYEGFARVRLNDEWYKIDANGNLHKE